MAHAVDDEQRPARRRPVRAMASRLWLRPGERHQRGGGERGRRFRRHHPAPFQGDDLIGLGDLVAAVGDVHHGHPDAAGQAGQEVDQLPAAVGVDHGGGLVGEDEAGVAGQGGRHGQALQLTAGEGGGVPFLHPCQPDGPQQAGDVDVRGGEAPHDVVGHPDAQDLGLGALQDHGRAAVLTEAGGAGSGQRP